MRQDPDIEKEQRRQAEKDPGNYPSPAAWWDALPASSRGLFLKDYGLALLSGKTDQEAADALITGTTTPALMERGMARRLDALRVLYDREDLELLEILVGTADATVEITLRHILHEIVAALIRGGGTQAEALWQMHQRHNRERLHPELAWTDEPSPPGSGRLEPSDSADWWKKSDN